MRRDTESGTRRAAHSI